MRTKQPQFPVAVHLFLRRSDEVLLLRRANTGYEDGNFSVVAGHLEMGETITQAATREAMEEAGVEIEESHLSVAGVMHRTSDSDRIDFFLDCWRWVGEVENREPDKCDELRWVRHDELPGNTIPYVRRALSLKRDGIWFDQFAR